jgi:hypothetical protein
MAIHPAPTGETATPQPSRRLRASVAKQCAVVAGAESTGRTCLQPHLAPVETGPPPTWVDSTSLQGFGRSLDWSAFGLAQARHGPRYRCDTDPSSHR